MLELEDPTGLVWVDLGGGTAENVKTMSKYIDLSKFEKIYVVDICGPLCDVARKKAAALGWNNVEIVEADVCEFEPDTKPATLITFSYSLSSKFILSLRNLLLDLLPLDSSVNRCVCTYAIFF
jgi:betaine lipid synthase